MFENIHQTKIFKLFWMQIRRSNKDTSKHGIRCSTFGYNMATRKTRKHSDILQNYSV